MEKFYRVITVIIFVNLKIVLDLWSMGINLFLALFIHDIYFILYSVEGTFYCNLFDFFSIQFLFSIYFSQLILIFINLSFYSPKLGRL